MENVPPINSKRKMYQLYHEGIFGNKPKTWRSYEQLIEENWQGKVTIRSTAGMDRKKVKYEIPVEKIVEILFEWEKEGISKDTLSFNESMPDKNLLIQGEVARLDTLILRYSKIKTQMNRALTIEDIHAYGRDAYFLLKKNLDYRSYENLESLMEIWPGHTVEFSTYDKSVGELHWNTIFWEVRNY